MSVHFLPENDQVFEIESVKCWSKKEIRASWYKSPYLQKLVKKRRNVALEWEADESSGLYIRGLETFTTQGKQRFTRVVDQCVSAVIDEQDIQWNNDQDDYERLAVVSREISRHCVTLALIRAEEDQIQANRIYKKMQKIRKSKKRRRRSTRESTAVPKQGEHSNGPIIVLDDNTSVCSDLSNPERGSFRSLDSTYSVGEGNQSWMISD